MLRSYNQCFKYLCSFLIRNYGNIGFHGKQIGDMVPILLVKNVLLTFQMEQNGMFLDNFKYDYWHCAKIDL